MTRIAKRFAHLMADKRARLVTYNVEALPHGGHAKRHVHLHA